MEKFDYDQVKAKMEDLSVVFNEFMTKLNKMNTKLNDSVNVGDGGAAQGVVATSLLESWNNCSDNFVNFKNEFDKLLNSVVQVSNSNAALEAEVMAMYGGNTSSTTTTSSSTSTTTTTRATTSGGGGSGITPSLGVGISNKFTTTYLR